MFVKGSARVSFSFVSCEFRVLFVCVLKSRYQLSVKTTSIVALRINGSNSRERQYSKTRIKENVQLGSSSGVVIFSEYCRQLLASLPGH